MVEDRTTNGWNHATSNDATGLVAGTIAPGTLLQQKNGQRPQVFSKQIEGQLFFNSTANAFKETITDFPGATWASGGALNTARYGAWVLEFKLLYFLVVTTNPPNSTSWL